MHAHVARRGKPKVGGDVLGGLNRCETRGLKAPEVSNLFEAMHVELPGVLSENGQTVPGEDLTQKVTAALGYQHQDLGVVKNMHPADAGDLSPLPVSQLILQRRSPAFPTEHAG